MTIDPPRRQDDYPDRIIDCQEAIEPLMQATMDIMFAHGWSPAETERAAFKMLAALRKTRIENAKVDADLAIMRAMEGARR